MPSASGATAGLAISRIDSGTRIYATDFRYARGDVLDQNFARVDSAGTFIDPNLPSGHTPCAIQNIESDLFVTCTHQDGEGDVRGIGHDYIDTFHIDGASVGGMAEPGVLNSPRTVARAVRFRRIRRRHPARQCR